MRLGIDKEASLTWVISHIKGFEHSPEHKERLAEGFQHEENIIPFEFWKYSIFIYLINSD